MSHSPLPCSKPLDIPLPNPSQSLPRMAENDNLTKSASNSPREIVRRVVERTSDKLGRSKSVGSKHSSKSQRPSLHGSPEHVVSQNQKGKGRQTASPSDVGGSHTTYPYCANS